MMNTMITANKARENMEQFKVNEKAEQLKRIKGYFADIKPMIEDASKKGYNYTIVEEMDRCDDQMEAEKILTSKEFGFTVEIVVGKNAIKISW